MVADAENLPYRSSYFACTYCFHSSWYLPDLAKAIDDMLRVTRSPGMVMFDIQNRNCPTIAAAYCKRVRSSSAMGMMQKYAKNVVKMTLRRGAVDWYSTVYEVPTSPETVYACLSDLGTTDFEVLARGDGDGLKLQRKRNSLESYDRLIFVVRK